uniref:Uncharacterized protein n=1 Tax=Panagrolaimus sp. PS1159 TaxID=55785 RepID=A0AC35FCD8_9BILA
MLVDQNFLLMVFCIPLVLVGAAFEEDAFPVDRTHLKAALVNPSDANTYNYASSLVTPVFENGQEIDFLLYLDMTSPTARAGTKTVCICMHTSEYGGNVKEKYCSKHARICFVADQCYGKNQVVKKDCKYDEVTFPQTDGRLFQKYHIKVNGNKAMVLNERDGDIELDIRLVSYQNQRKLPELDIGLVAFYDDTNTQHDCTDYIQKCHHADSLFIDTQLNDDLGPNELPSTVPPLVPVVTTKEPYNTTSSNITSAPPLPTTEETAGAGLALYISLGIVGAIVIA